MSARSRTVGFAAALSAVMAACGSNELPSVSVSLECKPSRECALQMARDRSRAEVKYEHARRGGRTEVLQLGELCEALRDVV